MPLDPYEMIWGCCKSFISNHLTFAFVDDTFVMYPLFSIPQEVICSHFLNRNQSMIGKHQLSFCDARQFCNLAFLPKVSVDAMLDHRHAENLRC
ncbi:hypothetical protein DXB92_13065 [Ruminococcus sp. OM06-36AC]|nr:hypothetical protein DXB92_13065 [Ruminococcus sp. OM06-36AC]